MQANKKYLKSILFSLSVSMFFASCTNMAPEKPVGVDNQAIEKSSSIPVTQSNSSQPVLNPANSHYYDAIATPGGITWVAAKAAAESRTFNGCPGHLVTLTSQQEHDFIIANLPQAAPIGVLGWWIGGIQPPGSPEPAGGWQWVTGEPFIFTNWAAGEPNDIGNEDAIHLDGKGSGLGLWNDIPSNNNIHRIGGYVIEYDTPCIIGVEFDIKPQSCPNPLNTKSKGILPVAVLGTSSFDANNIDVSTLQLEGVAPLRSDIEDVGTPVANRQDDCDCTSDGPDGFADLTLKFDTQDIVGALGAVNDGDEVPLTLTGNLNDGTPIEGLDCVVIKKKVK